MVWDDASIANLKLWCSQGLPFSAIAAAFGGGTTRNAVIGKASRLGLCKPFKPAAHPRRRRDRERERGLISRQPAKVVRPPVQRVDGIVSLQVPFLETGAGQCHEITGRNPDGTVTCCGRPTLSRVSYCEGHLKINNQTARRR